ncbi:carbon storage regulator CsrA [Savagea faecisuis]|uniref:Translational regulator CsrA n=1 Tax=Savagea faecisuis TaxID=1274803 RepID=A0ABW3GZS1_9BACL
MLVLARKKGETIQIGDNITLKVIDISGDTVRLGIDAPKSVELVRGELLEQLTDENKSAVATDLSSLMQLNNNEEK